MADVRVPRSTYRLQITKDWDLQDAAALVPYLQALGIDWVYLSPVLAAEPGSEHGYDVVDHGKVDDSRGGDHALAGVARAAHDAGLGVLVDIVPNHVGVASPELAVWWWDVLRRGRDSEHAVAFDIDWSIGGGKIRLPILGDGDNELDALQVVDDELRYYEHRLPIADGTAGGTAREVLARQHYELMNYRRADAELNYRRFFAITTLAGIRVEVPKVFRESHQEIKRWTDRGWVDGLRIDHPDGLADPGGYLAELAELIDHRYVVVEKIIEGDETLPETAAREVAEETGIIGNVLIELGTIDYWFAAGERRIHKYVHHFLLEAVGGDLTIENDPDHEAIDVAWLPLREAHRHLTFPNERRIARVAWQRLAGDA